GDSLPRLAIALIAMLLFGPSFAGRSKRMVSTSALVRCAAICAPMTPAPRTATLRMRRGEWFMQYLGRTDKGEARRQAAQNWMGLIPRADPPRQSGSGARPRARGGFFRTSPLAA